MIPQQGRLLQEPFRHGKHRALGGDWTVASAGVVWSTGAACLLRRSDWRSNWRSGGSSRRLRMGGDLLGPRPANQ